MNIELKLEPFHHLVVHDFYSPEQLDIILNELQEYFSYGKFSSDSDYTGSAYKDYKKLKRNAGLWLGHTDTSKSHIEKFFNEFMLKYHQSETFDEIRKKSWLFSASFPFLSSGLISYYEDGDNYEPHLDAAAFTWLTWVNTEPKKFTGGDLVFPDFDYKIEYKNNTAICFFSRLYHSVEVVEKQTSDEPDGRFCISIWQTFDNQPF
jgi:Rps23 Pro-64 3,4-dihydroxylase Tpa1-like proline 4-hydroxylase